MKICLFSQKIFIISTAGCVLALLGTSCGRRSAAVVPARSPDLVLITIDTLRADRVGIDDGVPGPTPALDALGRSGVVFLDATAHAAIRVMLRCAIPVAAVSAALTPPTKASTGSARGACATTG